jgi:uracil-DNA glycosylase family 4
MVELSELSCEPPSDCSLCPRLQDFRHHWQKKEPDWFNAPVPSFEGQGPIRLLIVGLAPGLRGANRTGRPFTGDYAGDLLYETLLKYGWAKGHYKAQPCDGLVLQNCMITNAVRCVPPENKPTTAEIKTCNSFLKKTIESLDSLQLILSLGKISHDAVLRAFDLPLSRYRFAHGARHELKPGLMLLDSYHCSRYNTQTGRLTREMFENMFEDKKNIIKIY